MDLLNLEWEKTAENSKAWKRMGWGPERKLALRKGCDPEEKRRAMVKMGKDLE